MKSKGTIYLEPRSQFDKALIDIDNIIYSFDLIIDVLMEGSDMDYLEAIDYFCFNIEPLTYQGLVLREESIDEV